MSYVSLKNRESIGLVVVTYHPPLDFYYYLSILSVQAKHIVIVDNTPTQECPDVLEKCNCLDNIEIIRNKMNCGIARALNQGIRRARLLGHEWVVTFDQDTRVDADFFVNIYKAYLVLDGHTTHPIAVMGANYTDMTSGAQPHQYPVAAGEAILVAAVITGWSPKFVREGAPFVYSPENAKLFVEAYPPIYEQLNDFLQDRGNFVKN